MAKGKSTPKISVSEIFFTFLKIGTFAFGGVYSMLSFFEKELVVKKKWIDHDEYTESVAIGQMTPGAPIVNTGICIGYRLKGIRGALATTAGQIFTGTIIAIVLAAFYIKAKNNSYLLSALKGVGASVAGLLFSVVFKMAKKGMKDAMSILFGAAAFLCMLWLKINPILIILAAAFCSMMISAARRT